MCTTAAKLLDQSQAEGSWFLMKTRDPVSWMRWDDEIKLFTSSEDKCRKLIIQNPDPNQDGYYGGINEHGVALVATYVKVAENQISYIRRPYVRLILDAQTALEAVEIVKSFNPHIGGNIFIADPKECYGIEGAPSEYFVERVEKQGVKTNHFHHIQLMDEDNKRDPFWRDWSQMHYQRAAELLAKADSVEDFQALLRDRKNSGKHMAICTTAAEKECYTYSAFIFDCEQACVYYAQGNPATTEFKRYGFEVT